MSASPSSPTRGPHPVRVLHVLPDLATGGGQQVLLRHVSAGDAARVLHHVAWFGTARDLSEPLRAAGATLHDLSGTRGLGAFGALRDVARAEQVDLLHTNGTPVDRLFGHLVAWRLGLPAVTTLHGLRPDPGPISLRPLALLDRARDALRRRVLRALDRRTLAAAIAVSDAVLDDWRAELGALGAPGPRRVTICTGVPLDVHAAASRERARVRAAIDVPDAAPLLLCVARLESGKRVHLLPPVLERVRRVHPATRLLVAGEGGERPRLERLVRDLGLDDAVLLAGRRDDVPELLAAADVFVFPSEREGFGLVVLEALAAGLPVVAEALPSLTHLRALDAGLVDATFADPDATAAQVVALLDDPSRRTELGARGRRVAAAHFDVRDSARRIEDLYLAVLADRRARATEPE
ncbi:MAG: glycosyltransferase [Planctomycetes bacterium]|nr:glycosyltransferase [Planctomycetota bacterium]